MEDLLKATKKASNIKEGTDSIFKTLLRQGVGFVLRTIPLKLKVVMLLLVSYIAYSIIDDIINILKAIF